MIVAINKMDLPQADIDRVKTDLTQLNLVPEEYGGDTVVVPVSAKTGEGVEDLLEYISLTAELEDLRADPKGEFAGVIIESTVDKQAGRAGHRDGARRHAARRRLSGGGRELRQDQGHDRAATASASRKPAPRTPVQMLGFSDRAQPAATRCRAPRTSTQAREVIAAARGQAPRRGRRPASGAR